LVSRQHDFSLSQKGKQIKYEWRI